MQALAPNRGSLSQATAPPRPESVARSSDGSGTTYRRAYRITGHAGTCLLQRVSVRIQYRCGTAVLVDYRSTYHEYFAIERDGADIVDLHDFDVIRDGWRQAAIEQLLRRCGPPSLARSLARKANGAPHLHVHKSFLLGAGQVVDARPTAVAEGTAFGFLAAGPGGPSRVRLTVAAGPDLPMHAIAGVSPCPGNQTVAGSGSFVGQHGWRAHERFHYSFACLAGSVRDRNGYRAATFRTTEPL